MSLIPILWVTLAFEPGTPSKMPPDLEVRLILSVEQFDPGHPKGTISCLAANKSKAKIELPAGYDGKNIVLIGSGVRLRSRRQPGKEDEQKLITIQPGKEEKLFELELAEILVGATEKDGKWRWDWERRPAPPISPILEQGNRAYRKSAQFQVDLTSPRDGAKASSPRVTLKITPRKTARCKTLVTRNSDFDKLSGPSCTGERGWLGDFNLLGPFRRTCRSRFRRRPILASQSRFLGGDSSKSAISPPSPS